VRLRGRLAAGRGGLKTRVSLDLLELGGLGGQSEKIVAVDAVLNRPAEFAPEPESDSRVALFRRSHDRRVGRGPGCFDEHRKAGVEDGEGLAEGGAFGGEDG